MRFLSLLLILCSTNILLAQSWHPAGSGARSSVNALEVFNGELYAGGLFTEIGGIDTNYLARWNGSAWDPVANLDTYMAAIGLYAYNTALLIRGEQQPLRLTQPLRN